MSRTLEPVLLMAIFLSLPAWTCSGQTRTLLKASPKQEVQAEYRTAGESPRAEVFADVQAHFTKADAGGGGAMWLSVSAEGMAGERVELRIPLANTGDVYGEDRSCSADGQRMVFAAGMDEKNFVAFAPVVEDKEFHLLLNKYLCRALAAPFRCGARAVTLKTAWEDWRLGGRMRLQLSSAGPAEVSVEKVSKMTTPTVFDRARCAAVAPSDGLCCVGGKTTEWHCGGTPVGVGWKQVSGECFHRKTGGVCKE